MVGAEIEHLRDQGIQVEAFTLGFADKRRAALLQQFQARERSIFETPSFWKSFWTLAYSVDVCKRTHLGVLVNCLKNESSCDRSNKCKYKYVTRKVEHKGVAAVS